MYIPVWLSVRGVIAAGVLLLAVSLSVLKDFLKEKSDYAVTTGRVEYVDKKLGELPKRHIGIFRYLIIDSYQFPFEIYKDNSQPTRLTLDSLNVGDTVTVYYFERDYTYRDQLNKFVQFVDRGSDPVFIRNDFQLKLGYSLVFLSLGVIILALVLGRTGNLEW